MWQKNNKNAITFYFPSEFLTVCIIVRDWLCPWNQKSIILKIKKFFFRSSITWSTCRFKNDVIWIEFIFLQFNMEKLFPVSFEISSWGITTISYVVAAIGLLKTVLCPNLWNAVNRVISGLEFLCAGGQGPPAIPAIFFQIFVQHGAIDPNNICWNHF